MLSLVLGLMLEDSLVEGELLAELDSLTEGL